MFSPSLCKIIKDHNTLALRYIHQSLHIEDKVTTLIRKQKLLSYPNGTSFAGV